MSNKPFNNHSPLPWHDSKYGFQDVHYNYMQDGYEDYWFRKAEDVGFILHAVNTYYEREKAFKALIKELYFATQAYEITFHAKPLASGGQGSITIGPNNTNTLRLAIEKAEKALEPKAPSVPAREEK